MKKKVSLFFICFCFCVLMFSLQANASATITLENGTEITLSKAPVGTVTAKCDVATDEVTTTSAGGSSSATVYTLQTKTIYLVTAGTKVSFPDADNWQSEGFMSGKSLGESVKNAYYWSGDGGAGDYNNYVVLNNDAQTPDSDGIFEYITVLGLLKNTVGTDESGDSTYNVEVIDYFYYVVVDPSYLVSSAKLTPTLTNTSSGIKVSWNQAAGATGYYIYRKTSSAKSYTKIKTIKSSSTLSYTDTAVKSKNGTTYYYKVIPYSGSKQGTSTATKIVRLTSPTLSSVKNTASKKITVKWKKNSKATGYQIQYSRSSTFASGTNKTRKVSGASTVKYNLTSLIKGAKYYVRIRAYKTVGGKTYYSAWSSKKSVKISK